jgi:release factor glutamine methyltransferase
VGRYSLAVPALARLAGRVPDAAELVATLRGAGCVFAEEEARLLLATARDDAELDRLVRQRVAGTPLEHLLGWVEFDGLRIAVEPGVFVPRRRTELLVREAARRAPPRAVVVELCCGAGAVAAALTARLDDPDVYAVDVDPVAIRCARRNLPGGHVHRGDLDAPLPGRLERRVDVLVANAPYVPTGEISLMPPEARDHEPRVALDGGADGLDVARRVVAAAARWLAPGGVLLVETSERQAPALLAAATTAGLLPALVHDENTGGTAVLASSLRR